MAQFPHQYVAEMLRRQHGLAQGHPEIIKTDPMWLGPEGYSLNLMNLLLFGVIMKVISDVAPQVTDQVWIDRLNTAIDSSPELPWPAWILAQDPTLGGQV